MELRIIIVGFNYIIWDRNDIFVQIVILVVGKSKTMNCKIKYLNIKVNFKYDFKYNKFIIIIN